MKNISFLLILITSVMSIQAQNTITETEVFATTNQAVGNITFTDTGDLVYSHHPFFAPENRVMIMDAKTKTRKCQFVYF